MKNERKKQREKRKELKKQERVVKREKKVVKQKPWKVKNERPEETIRDPKKFYSTEEVKRYANSSGMQNVQEKIAKRILNLIDLKKGSKILDMGCGSGNTALVYKSAGLNVIGLDLIQEMLDFTKKKGIQTVKGDMRELTDLFESESFDGIASASAMQWIKNRVDFLAVASGVFHALKKGGKAVIQFYPESEIELNSSKAAFQKIGFKTDVIVDNPDNSRKRVIYIIARKP